MDEYVGEVDRLIHQKGFSDYHPFNFECVNVCYFLKLVKQYTPKLNEFELARYRNAKATSMIQNPSVRKQFKVFENCVNILNYLIKKWDLLYENEIDFHYKADPNLDMITLIDIQAVKCTTISMEILWFCTENSPMRYMIKNMEDYLPEF